MFTFERRDEGFLIHAPDGRTVADVACAAIEFHDDPRLKNPERVVNVMPRDKWRVHFTSHKLSPPELVALAEQLNAQEF